MSESFEKMYRWYLLGCRLQEQTPMTREEFIEEVTVQELLGNSLTAEVYERTPAEIELDREDATWTAILQRLANLNFGPEKSELVAAIQRGRDADDEGDMGSAGAGVARYPILPVLSGAGALPLPIREAEELLCFA